MCRGAWFATQMARNLNQTLKTLQLSINGEDYLGIQALSDAVPKGHENTTTFFFEVLRLVGMIVGASQAFIVLRSPIATFCYLFIIFILLPSLSVLLLLFPMARVANWMPLWFLYLPFLHYSFFPVVRRVQRSCSENRWMPGLHHLTTLCKRQKYLLRKRTGHLWNDLSTCLVQAEKACGLTVEAAISNSENGTSGTRDSLEKRPCCPATDEKVTFFLFLYLE